MRVAVTPEEIGLCGCWQIIAVRRESIPIILGCNAGEPSDVIAYYASSTGYKQLSDQEILKSIRGHWDAIESGSHYRRDVSFGEDNCQIKNRGAAQVMATFKNLAIGAYELKKERGQIKKGKGLKASCRRLVFSDALAILTH